MSIYGCFNKPRPVANAPLAVQDGAHQLATYSDGSIARAARMVTVPYAMSTACQYTQQHASDAYCSGCVHRAVSLGEQAQ